MYVRIPIISDYAWLLTIWSQPIHLFKRGIGTEANMLWLYSDQFGGFWTSNDDIATKKILRRVEIIWEEVHAGSESRPSKAVDIKTLGE